MEIPIEELIDELTQLPRTVKIDGHRSAFVLGNSLRGRLIEALRDTRAREEVDRG